jgi:hypothetical protein
MVMNWGMSERLGPVSYKLADDDPFLGREMHQQRHFSESTMETIDQEVARILREPRASTTLLSARAGSRSGKPCSSGRMNEQNRQILGPSIHAKSNGHRRQRSRECDRAESHSIWAKLGMRKLVTHSCLIAAPRSHNEDLRIHPFGGPPQPLIRKA